MSKNNISATELNNNLKNRLIIDVRESNEYKAEHILNAINIPLSKINYEEIKNNSSEGFQKITIRQNRGLSFFYASVFSKQKNNNFYHEHF